MTTPPTPTPTPLNVGNIQGDIVLGLPKKVQEFVFFQITDVAVFKTKLQDIVPLITTTAQVMSDRANIAKSKSDAARSGSSPPLLPLVGTNIAFSQFGLTKLGITDDLGDPIFKSGQQMDAGPGLLQDKGTTDANKNFIPDWEEPFLQNLDGVYFITGESWNTVNKRNSQITQILQACIKVIDTEKGNVRPCKEKGHEHFGFQDGISNPAIRGFGSAFLGQEDVDSGVVLLGNGIDNDITRPPWAKDGSFLVFRKLKQLVPEFNDFLLKNGTGFPGLTPKEGAEFLGARLVGRWKSGAPIDLTPLKDDKDIAKDPNRNNDFGYRAKAPDDQQDQTRCPFTAHVRKTNPRGDLDIFSGTEPNRIIRQGIAYGPEVTDHEKHAKVTEEQRGLLFVCYQSNIGNGFHFIQTRWANNTGFPPRKNVPFIGFDPIIGQQGDSPRPIAGFNPQAQNNQLTLTTNFVQPRGGEYFFSPSISALKDTLGASA